MQNSQLPLKALRAFEAAARHLSFTRAGLRAWLLAAAAGDRDRAASLHAPARRRR